MSLSFPRKDPRSGRTSTLVCRGLTRLRSVQHQPADGDVAVPQAVEQLGDVVQDDLLAEEALLQQLLHLGLQTLHAVCVAARLQDRATHTHVTGLRCHKC